MQKSHHCTFALILLGLMLIAAGCGDGRPTRVPVSGQVLIDGKPLTVGSVWFIPSGARPSVGKLDSEGRFSLGCFEANDGAVVGTHQIEVKAQEPAGEEAVKWFAPKKYASANTSGLSETIQEPTNSLIINLTWEGKPGPFIERFD